MNAPILERLIWKDARTIKPLVIAIGIGIVGINFLLLVLAHTDSISTRSRAEFCFALCVLLPNLMAFGSSGMLVGTEEENGSLAWLRTLPASWRSIAASKLLVSLSCVLAAWVLCGLVFLCQRFLASDILSTASHRDTDSTEWFILIAGNIAFGIGLTICGFLTSYLFRSPINALLSVLPIATGFTIGFFWIGHEVSDWYAASRVPRELDQAFLLIHSVLIALILSALYFASQWAAKRRLSGPDRSSNRKAKLDQSMEGFRPPSSAPRSWYAVSLTRERPSPIKALLWQSFRQQGWWLVALSLIGSISVLVYAATDFYDRRTSPVGMLLPLTSSVCLFAIASLTFYGDSVKKRCVFLADRGISPTLVWLTRVLPSLFAVLLIAICYWGCALVGGYRSSNIQLMLLMMIGGFALCQLVSQSSPRPILAFFGGPPVLYVVIVLFAPLAFAYGDLPSFLMAGFWVAVPILLLASYWLTPLWMRGETGKRYTLRCLAFIAAAVVFPYFFVLGGRWATMPPVDAQWQQQMLSFEFPDRPEGETPVDHLLDTNGFQPHGAKLEPPGNFATEEQIAKFEMELSSPDVIGSVLNVTDVIKHMGYHRAGYSKLSFGGGYPYFVPQDMPQERVDEFLEDAYQRDLRAFRVLLKWANAVRNEARYGFSNLERLCVNAEQNESLVATFIQQHIEEYGLKPEIEKVIGSFPGSELVEESRVHCITVEWQRMREAEGQVRLFRTDLGHNRLWPFRFEREREMRLIDRDVKRAIDYLKREYRTERKGLSLNEPTRHGIDLGQSGYLIREFRDRDNAVAAMQHLAESKEADNTRSKSLALSWNAPSIQRWTAERSTTIIGRELLTKSNLEAKP